MAFKRFPIVTVENKAGLLQLLKEKMDIKFVTFRKVLNTSDILLSNSVRSTCFTKENLSFLLLNAQLLFAVAMSRFDFAPWGYVLASAFNLKNERFSYNCSLLVYYKLRHLFLDKGGLRKTSILRETIVKM